MGNKFRQYLGKECPYCNGEITKQRNGSETEYHCQQCGKVMKKLSEIFDYDLFFKFIIPCQLLITLFTRDAEGYHWDRFFRNVLISIPALIIIEIVIITVRYIIGNDKRIK